jgi:hypothetical protein
MSNYGWYLALQGFQLDFIFLDLAGSLSVGLLSDEARSSGPSMASNRSLLSCLINNLRVFYSRPGSWVVERSNTECFLTAQESGIWREAID